MDDSSWIAISRVSFALAEGASQTHWDFRIGQSVHGISETEKPDGEADAGNLYKFWPWFKSKYHGPL